MHLGSFISLLPNRPLAKLKLDQLLLLQKSSEMKATQTFTRGANLNMQIIFSNYLAADVQNSLKNEL